LSLILITASFDVQQLFNLIQYHLPIIALISWAIGGLTALPMPMSSRVFSVFLQLLQSFTSHIKIFLSFWIGFCTGCEIGIWFHSSTSKYSVFPAPFVVKAVFSPKHIFWHLCWKWNATSMWAYIQIFYSFGLYICFCASTTLFLLLWFCNIFWSQVL
jgi:hypothetical protein